MATTYDFDVEDVEYLRHGAKPLLARLFKPKGKGPFPTIVEAHGGAWCLNTRVKNIAIHEALAKSGVVVAALDFRMPPEAGYPASLADINYGIRWMKLHAEDFASRPDWVGSLGTSSGGHQVMLDAMKPEDPRYAFLPLPGGSPEYDAGVRCVIMCWPVIDPLRRYQYMKQAHAEKRKFDSPLDPFTVIPHHDAFWGTEAAMEEGNPEMILERGEKVEMPPTLYIVGDRDPFNPPETPKRFADNYRKAGGHIELEWYKNQDHLFITNFPTAPESLAALDKIVEFVHRVIK